MTDYLGLAAPPRPEFVICDLFPPREILPRPLSWHRPGFPELSKPNRNYYSMTSPSEAVDQIREAKGRKGLTWEQIAAHVGRSPVYITSACLGENSLSLEDAKKLGALLDLAPDIVESLQSCPKKGSGSLDIPKDPLLYRFHEINLVYGDTLKELIHEKFGDGIMSAIDFTMEVEKVEDPKGDRVMVTMCGKFLPYKKW
jgi:cyanate lyase